MVFCIPGKDLVGVGVGALIMRDNNALMLLRTDKCRNNVGKWTVPGGMVEVKERVEDAIMREVMEETGLKVTSVVLLTVSDREFNDQHWVSLMYLCGTEGEPVNAEPEKHERIEWIDINELPDNVTSPSMDAIIAYMNVI